LTFNILTDDEMDMSVDIHRQQEKNHILWRQTSHRHRISTEGRNRPAPGIGSPTLIWHLGVWRKYNHAKSPAKGQGEAPPHDSYIDSFERHSIHFYEEVFGFLHDLQKRGLRKEEPDQPFKLESIAIEGINNEDIAAEMKPRRFPVFAPQSASFTLWWRDSAKNRVPNTRIHGDDRDVDQALRVFVQFQGFHDHITLTFYIDAAKLFTGRQILKREEVEANRLGERRTCLLNHLDAIRSSSYDRIVSGAIDLPSSDRPVDPEVAEALKTAADYVFEDIWNEFQSAFGFRTRAQDEQAPEDATPFLDHGLIFVNQRGLMMSVRGLKTGDDEERLKLINDLKARNDIKVEDEQAIPERPWRQLGRSASGTLGPVDVFDAKCGEPETLLKSFWPFLCQMTEHAARKDWIGCGILDWRALFMSTLGSRAQPPVPEAAGNVPVHRRTLAPERFFIVTKGEPHRRQIGRMVERLVSLETMRAIAFKNLGTIQNASLHLRTLTMALDDILERWATDRKKIQEPWDKVRKKFRGDRRPGEVFRRLPPKYIVEEEHFYDQLSALNAEYETQLIDIAASLETMGPGGSGHLAQSIDEASYYIGEFDRMMPTLEIGNISGWINYAQFADRGMRPTFNMIKNTGQRLVAAQDRLKALTDVVQVSALIVQSDATRRNTDTLREIANNLDLLNRPALFLRSRLGAVLFGMLVLIAVYFAGIMKLVEPTVNWITSHFPGVMKVVESVADWIISHLPW
jgi:hypothetical protein